MDCGAQVISPDRGLDAAADGCAAVASIGFIFISVAC